jgi:hypothetical protein
MDLLDQTPDNTKKTSSDMPDLESLMNPQQSDHPAPEKNANNTTNYGVFDANKAEQKKTEESLTTPTHQLPPDIPEEPTPPPPTSNSKKRGIPKGIVFSVIALVLITLPVIGYFVNQRTQSVADIRSSAAESCDWCAGADQCPNAPIQVPTNVCSNGYCCMGYRNDGGGNPQPTSAPQPTAPPSGCPFGQIPCGGCIQGCRANTQTCNTWIDQECQQQGCAGDGVFAGTQQCCSGLQLCGNGRCGTTCVAPPALTPVPSTCQSVSGQVCRNSCNMEELSVGGIGSCLPGQVCCKFESTQTATPTLPRIQSCRNSGNSAINCDGKKPGDNLGPCTCQYSSLGQNDCACIAASASIPVTSGSPNNCSSGGQSCESTGCCSGLVCQGQSGSRLCQPQTANVCPGSVCGGRLIAFHCTSWFDSECLDNPIYIENGDMATALAHINGCGQVDQVCSGGANENKLCGEFNIIKSSCGTNPSSPPVVTNPPLSDVCQNIKIYKDGVMLTSNQYNSIKPGNAITFAAVTAPSVTQARFTINNGIPQTTTQKNNEGELILNYTVPQVTVVTQFTVQAEILSDGQWR